MSPRSSSPLNVENDLGNSRYLKVFNIWKVHIIDIVQPFKNRIFKTNKQKTPHFQRMSHDMATSSLDFFYI